MIFVTSGMIYIALPNSELSPGILPEMIFFWFMILFTCGFT